MYMKREKLVKLMNNLKQQMLTAYKELPRSDRPDTDYKDRLLSVTPSVS